VVRRRHGVLLGNRHLGVHAMSEPGDLPLRGNQCLCRACGQYFKSVFAFEKHRTGTFRPMARRCRTEFEMRAVGMALRGAFWISSEWNFNSPVHADSQSAAPAEPAGRP
jgi:hypothetical protein